MRGNMQVWKASWTQRIQTSHRNANGTDVVNTLELYSSPASPKSLTQKSLNWAWVRWWDQRENTELPVITELWYPRKHQDIPAGKGHCSTQNLNWDHCCKPWQQLRRGTQISARAQKRPQEKWEGGELCNHSLNSSAGQLWSHAIIPYRYRRMGKGKREKVFNKNQGKKKWQLPACGSKHYLQVQKLSSSLCPATQSWALPCCHRKLGCCTWLIQTLLLPCAQHRHLLTNWKGNYACKNALSLTDTEATHRRKVIHQRFISKLTHILYFCFISPETGKALNC